MPKTKIISVRVTDKEFTDLSVIAKMKKVTVSKLVLDAVFAHYRHTLWAINIDLTFKDVT